VPWQCQDFNPFTKLLELGIGSDKRGANAHGQFSRETIRKPQLVRAAKTRSTKGSLFIYWNWLYNRARGLKTQVDLLSVEITRKYAGSFV
jgi:hypothetical protein